MALTKELLNVLNNADEPLSKRLKIADNAFKSVELPVQNLQSILLKWLGKLTSSGETNWDMLQSWLTSQQMQDLSRNDFTQEDVKTLMNIIKRKRHADSLDHAAVINCAAALIEHRNFQQFFKHDLENYCKFVSSILNKIDDTNQLHNFLTKEHLFNRSLISSDNFYEFFIKYCLPGLSLVAEKFNSNAMIFQGVSKLIEKCLFHRNFRSISTYFKPLFNEEAMPDEKPSPLPELLLKNLEKCYKSDKIHPRFLYKMIFHSFCNSYVNHFEEIYKFFILMTETLGFNLDNYFGLNKISQFHNSSYSLDKSVAILTELCLVLTERTNNFNCAIKNRTFTDFMQNLALSIISATGQPSENCYKFLICIIILDPLTGEKIMKEMLVYTMLSSNETTEALYAKFLVGLFEVFAKLHQIPKFIADMITTLETVLDEDFQYASSAIHFSEQHEHLPQRTSDRSTRDVLPPAVLEYFTLSITTLASWQTMNLFQTFLQHLDAAVSRDLSNANDVGARVFYIDFISTLLSQFLASVRVAEHTVPTVVVKNFVEHMEKLRDILGKFGTALVNVEHNAVLMRSYLNTCYTWGELYATMAYYTINDEVMLHRSLDSDSAACNLTYLHPYLTRDQWRLIAQRITNFGEKSCKQIMHKLYIQKLRVMLLFEGTVSDEVLGSIRTNILISVEDNWRDLVFDQLVLKQIVVLSSSLKRVAELVLQDATATRNYQQLSLLFDCKEMTNMLLFVCLSKLNKACKGKHKKEQLAVRPSLASRVFPSIPNDFFAGQPLNSAGVQELRETFVRELAGENESSCNEVKLSVNENDLSNYLDVLKAIPVMQFNNGNMQEVLMIYLICLLMDIHNSSLQNKELINRYESVIISISEQYRGHFETMISLFCAMQIIVDMFTRYADIFMSISRVCFSYASSLRQMKEGVTFLAQHISDERYLPCATAVLNSIYKNKSKDTEIKKLLAEYEEKLYKSIYKHLKKEKDTPDVLLLTEAYALALHRSLGTDVQDDFKELLTYLDKYLEGIVVISMESRKHVRGAIPFLTMILRNLPKFKATQANIVLQAWNCCQNLAVTEREYEDYSALIVLIFEHIPNEQLSKIADDFLNLTAQALKEHNIKQVLEHMKIWCAITCCKFNATKTEIWQQVLQALLLTTLLAYLRADNKIEQEERQNIYEAIVKLEINFMRNFQITMTPSLLDTVLVTVTIMTSVPSSNFVPMFTQCISLLETLVKYRNALIMDCLPPYLQRYRTLLSQLCARSNSDLSLQAGEIEQVADCAHKLEKLTKTLVVSKKDIVRIAPYLSADILKQYEEITLYPTVKIHLNNCLYHLISVMDKHAVAFLMRVLSTASTEMFKIIYDNYKKYYRFTGKV